jgi:hypothetical protein
MQLIAQTRAQKAYFLSQLNLPSGLQTSQMALVNHYYNWYHMRNQRRKLVNQLLSPAWTQLIIYHDGLQNIHPYLGKVQTCMQHRIHRSFFFFFLKKIVITLVLSWFNEMKYSQFTDHTGVHEIALMNLTFFKNIYAFDKSVLCIALS